jgi:small subunit ribosomal protein S21
VIHSHTVGEGRQGYPKEHYSTMAIEIEVRGDIEQAMRLLKKKLQLDGIKKELKRRECYEKPSIKRRRKQEEAKRKLRKLAMRQTSE